MAIETSGTWGEQASDLVREIGRRIAAVEHEPRSTVFLRQRISVAIQRDNAFCIMETFRRMDSVVAVGVWTELKEFLTIFSIFYNHYVQY